jgi:acyl transferase domain-containing protein
VPKIQLPNSRHLPVAIVGAACRLPGAPNVPAFWDVLSSGRDVIGELPAGRRDTRLGSPVTRGGFLERIDGFDAPFFEVSPHEAVRIDPHHRLLLETTWEAIEDAGVPAGDLAGSRTGVYTACLSSHYWNLLHDAGMHDMHAVLGAHRWSVPAGRIAHFLDLRGPSLGAESTCASSLVAVHLASQALRSGEIDLAIVGAVNLLFGHKERLAMAEAGLLSPTARCRFGDAAADGYVPAEGAVTLFLRPLADAVEAGDRIYATILGSAVNSNGRQAASAGATGATGQEDLLRLAFRDAGITPSDVDYVEAHGPGTPLGDRVELAALDRVLREERAVDQPCLLGSVKSNIGHTEAAAGLAGLLKTALALRHRIVPATLHAQRPNPVLRDSAPLELVRVARPWPRRGRPAIAGVTALGLFGTGAHVVLTEPPRTGSAGAPARPGRAGLLPLSARHPAALKALASAYAGTVASAPNLADVCFSAGARRTHHPYRAAVVGAGRQALVDRLREIADRPSVAGVWPLGSPRVVFVFSGQGSQWHGMGRELVAGGGIFAERLRACAEVIHAERGWRLIDRLHDGRPLTADHEIQPALWAMQVSLAETWRDWGIEPDLVLGHSMGEVAAATVSGALTLRDAAAVICRRSVLVGTLDEPGAMVAVQLGHREAAAAIGGYRGRVSVAVVNGPHSTVLAGDAAALDAVVEPLRDRGVFCRPVKAGYASHSPLVEPLRDDMLNALAELRPRAGHTPMHSTVLDRVVPGDELDAGYWMANLREPVRFGAAVRAALAPTGPVVFIEVSPHPLLIPAIEAGIDTYGPDAVAIASLVREQPERESLLSGLGTAYVHGCDPDWTRLSEAGRFAELPTYPWRHERFWVEHTEEAGTDIPAAEPPASGHPAPPATDLTEHLRRRAAEVLGGPVDPAAPLTMAGMDSLLAARLRRRLEQDLGFRMPIADLLGDRPLTEIASRLGALIGHPYPGPAPKAASG